MAIGIVRCNGVDDEERDDWQRVFRSLGTGFLVRWDLHDPRSLEEEVGPMNRHRAGERVLDAAWFD
jgi:hypothetical protein